MVTEWHQKQPKVRESALMRMPVEQTLEVPSLALQRGGQALARRRGPQLTA